MSSPSAAAAASATERRYRRSVRKASGAYRRVSELRRVIEFAETHSMKLAADLWRLHVLRPILRLFNRQPENSNDLVELLPTIRDQETNALNKLRVAMNLCYAHHATSILLLRLMERDVQATVTALIDAEALEPVTTLENMLASAKGATATAAAAAESDSDSI